MFEVDLSVRRGDFRLEARFSAPTPGVIALFGASGAGKSTLVNAIAGLTPVVPGHLRVDGTTWLDAHTDVPAERRRIGYVFQDARLFPHLGVLGNLAYGERRAPAGERFVARADVIALLGLAGLLERGVQQLSGGERQRVALARALLSQPRLLLLDEPLAALDVARREDVLPYLEKLRDRYAIPMLYVSHQYEEVLRLATYVVLLEAGRVLGTGTPAAISLDARLRSRIAPEAVGAVLDVEVTEGAARSGLVTVALGGERLRLVARGVAAGAHLRVQVLARDVILATEAPHGLSVRNVLRGTLALLEQDGPDHLLASVDVGGARLLARITPEARSELALEPGRAVWVLVKAASFQGHAFLYGAHN